MVSFNGSMLIMGCGSVSQCTIPLILKHIKMPANRITILDMVDNRARVIKQLELGIKYVEKQLTPENYPKVLGTYLKSGDILLDLTCNVETTDLLQWCHDNNVMYLNTAVEEWEPYDDRKTQDPRSLTLYARQMDIRKMINSWSKKGPTLVVDHGANPGLVSHFTKQALMEIGTKIVKTKPKDPRVKELNKALADQHFAKLGHLTGTKVIHISERDTQIIKKPKEVNEFVNTWSVDGFIEEGLAPSEMGWGTHEKKLPQGALTHKSGPQNQICLASKGIHTLVKSWVPSGPIIGMAVRHGEAFSISDFLTLRDNNDKAIYRPTIHYAYVPCDAAINSFKELDMAGCVPQQKKRVVSDEIISGQDQLGCLLMGHDFNAWWIGSLLSIEEARALVPGQNATTLQVACSIIGALTYMIKNPDLGYCLPDHFDHEEILQVARPYLGTFVSEPVTWNPMYKPEGSLEYQEKIIKPEDLWQFESFLVNAY